MGLLMLLFHDFFPHVILLPLLLNICLHFLFPQLHFLLPLIAFTFMFLFKVLHYIRGAPSALFSLGLQRFHLSHFFLWCGSSIPWRFSCASLPLFFPPFLCSLPQSFFHLRTCSCQLFHQEVGLALTPHTKCQRHFPLCIVRYRSFLVVFRASLSQKLGGW